MQKIRIVTNQIISTTELMCNIEHDCPEGCECKHCPIDRTLILECSTSNLLKISTSPQFVELNFTNIELHAANNQK